jgi:protein ImuB
VKQILCVRLKNWPIDRLLRRLQRDGGQSLDVSGRSTASDAPIAPANGIRRVRGRPTNDPPRKRRWTHQLWQDGPKDLKVTSIADRSSATNAIQPRSKLFMPSRGICMTPSIRANGPSYMKPVPPPVQRSANVTTAKDRPIVITRTVANRQIVVAMSSSAAAMGVRPGLTLTESRALCPDLSNAEHDPARDARALEALARWMMRFTPVVALPETSKDESEISNLKSQISHSIYLDLTGCERVFGGVSNIVRDVMTSLNRLRVSASVAVASTPGAAWALASFSDNGRIIPREDLSSVLSTLPVAGLRLDDDLLESLHHLGIETIGQVISLPRHALPSRFGSKLLHRIDQALGRIAEPLVPLTYFAPIEARMDFDGAVDSIEAIYLVFKRLIGDVVSELARRGCGVREIEIEFFRAYAQTIKHTIGLSRPSRDPVNLFNLIRCATENLDGGGDGFLGIRLFVARAERISDEQIALLDQERYAGEIELAQLIERLRVRMGEGAIATPALVESHLPERAWTYACVSTRVENPCHGRPLQLLPEPTEIAVMVSPSEDRDGRPILFRHQHQVHELRHAIGPERISGEWWRGHDRTRDYFDVEDDEGRRFWLFRVQETNRWYLHGVF